MYSDPLFLKCIFPALQMLVKVCIIHGGSFDTIIRSENFYLFILFILNGAKTDFHCGLIIKCQYNYPEPNLHNILFQPKNYLNKINCICYLLSTS